MCPPIAAHSSRRREPSAAEGAVAGDDARARADDVVEEPFAARPGDPALDEELARVRGADPRRQPGARERRVAQLLRRPVLGPRPQHALVALARLGRIAQRLHPAQLDRFLGDEADVRLALGLVGVEQVDRGEAAEDEVELPGDVVGVAHPRAHALGEEGRHLVGGVAGQQHPALAPALRHPRAEDVVGDPDQLRFVRLRGSRRPAPRPAPGRSPWPGLRRARA